MTTNRTTTPKLTGNIQRLRIPRTDIADIAMDLENDPAFLRDLQRADELANQMMDERHPMERSVASVLR